MPTYDYQCLKCKKKFEKFQSMNDKKLTACIYCKGKVERLIGGGARLIFKGSGFYQTDYKNKPASSDKPASNKTTPDKASSEKSKDVKGAGSSAKKVTEKKIES